MSRILLLLFITLFAATACQDSTAPLARDPGLALQGPSRLVADGDAAAALAELDAMDASAADLTDFWAANYSGTFTCPPDVYCQTISSGACADYQRQMMSELEIYHFWAGRSRQQEDTFYMLLYRSYARNHYNAAMGWSSKLLAGRCLRNA